MFDDIATLPQTCEEVSQPRQSILIVDDDASQAETLAHCLERQGFDTVVAHQGQPALEWAHHHLPDLVVLDLRLPDVSGLEVCENLVDSPQTSDIPVIVVSGVEQPDVVRQCRAAGSTYFLHKPFDPNALLSLIHCALYRGLES
jgi:CheY-like chemotaxis protein